MGKLLEMLKQAGTRRPVSDEPVVLAADPAPEIHEDEDPETEIPFIEVGPHKSLEASASVLAYRPAPARTAVPAPAAAKVAFRPVALQGGVATSSRLDPELIAFHQPDHPIGEQYRDLLAALTATAPAGLPRTLLFLSVAAESDEGAVLLNVAVTAARTGRLRVVVVDADLRRPRAAKRLGLEEAPGLREVLNGAVSLEQALRPTEQANLFALTAGASVAGGGLRFVAETTRSVLHQLRQRFDLVLVQGAHGDAQSDATNLGAACDAVCLTASEEDADSPRLDELLQTLPQQGVRVAGCILAGREVAAL